MTPRPRVRPLAAAFACVVLPAAFAPNAPPNDLVARGLKGAVVAAEPRAAAIGLRVLQDGGNAVDAAVATALALSVTHPQAGNLGGGGFLVFRAADGKTAAIDFREKAPAAALRDMFLKPDGTVDADKAMYGALAAGVPGSPAGLLLALEKYGTKPLVELAAPAIALARDGFPIDHFLAADLRAAKKELARFPSTVKVFFANGEPLQQGAVLVQAELAATLERFAAGGRDGFYGGRTAELIAAQMQQSGGAITAADLAAYAAVEREPLRGTYRGHEVIGMPPPSSGGVALQQMLNVLEPYDLRGIGHGGSAYLHLLTEAMRRAYADRARWLGDPDFANVPLAGLAAKDYAAKLREGVRTDRRSDVKPGVPPGAPESDDTTHLSVIDAAGNAVALTTTINATFGSALVVEGAGFLLNDEMDDFSAKPGVPNMFGLVGGAANAIAPGKRMLSSMTPTIVARDGKVRFVLGSPGGGRIINAVLQVLLNVVDHGMGLEQAVRAPRIHHQWTPDVLQWEPLALPPDVRAGLSGLGHPIAERSRSIGQVLAIAVRDNGERVAVCDHRSGGAAVAF